MSARQDQMKLAVFIHNTGAHPAGWRYPGAAAGALHDIDFYRGLAQTAERGKMDAFFLGDAQGHFHIEGREAYSRADHAGKLEPTTLLAALAMATRNIGLIGTASTTYNEPYAIARRFASLDHISKGRAGWNVVTSTTNSEARNFGRASNMAHDQRYDRAGEFVDVVKGLWDSWEDGAIVADQAEGRYFDPDKVHALHHKGEHFSVAGPLNVGRPPQGHPIVVQAGASGPGRRLAARTADLVFTAQRTLQSAQTFYAEIKQQAADFGRDPQSLKVVPSLQLLVRGTEAEAKAAEAELLELIPDGLAVSMLQMLMGGFDLSAYPLDGPLPEVPLTNGGQWVQEQLVAMARTEGLSIRQLARRASVSRASLSMAGAPEQIADMLQAWFEGRAADGFCLTPHYLPGGLDDFVETVVPILQARGLFREEYEGTTLRENIGLARPQNLFVQHPQMHHEPQIWAPVASQVGGE